jgi:glycosyltransferase involved in cell wall biosynthesis
MKMLLSIIIATYNRSNDVKKVIDELERQFEHLVIDFPDQDLQKQVELVLVDNNSSDDTGAMAFQKLSEQKRKSEKLLELKYFLEMEQGSSAARNRGIKEAQGDLLAFLDDDIELDKNWLKNAYELSKEKKENFCNGSRVIPVWAKEPLPDWLSIKPPYEIIQSCFPAHDHGDQKKEYPFNFVDTERKVQNPISACFICSKDIFAKYGDFRLDLGIKADKRGACEDTEFFWRIQKAGVKIEYNPELTVYHPIVVEKLDKEFVLRWYKLLGKTMEFMKDKKLTHLSPDSKVSPKSKLLVKSILYSLMKIFAISNPRKSFWFECQKAYAKGQLEYKN